MRTNVGPLPKTLPHLLVEGKYVPVVPPGAYPAVIQSDMFASYPFCCVKEFVSAYMHICLCAQLLSYCS